MAVVMTAAVIARKADRYKHRRGNPANAVYPVIGEPVENLLTRFHEKMKHVEPADDGLTKLALIGSALNEGTYVYFLDNRVVAFRIIPLSSHMSAVEQRSRCTLEYAQVQEGFIEGDYSVMETIRSEGNTLKDWLGHEIWFLPSRTGSLLVLDETVADKLGVQIIQLSTVAAPDENRADATPTPTAASQNANGQPAAVADQEVEIIRPHARFRVPRSYTFVRSFRNEAEDVVILARNGRNDGATVLAPDVQLSFCTDRKRFEEYVRYGSADVPETATLTAILNTLPQENFNGNTVRVQQNIIAGKIRNISYQHLGTDGGVSFSFRLRTIGSNNNEQIDYSTLVKALKATLSLERHTDDETRANEASLSGKWALSARTASELSAESWARADEIDQRAVRVLGFAPTKALVSSLRLP